MKSIFEYFDYHEFLKDFYDEKKSINPYFSYRHMSSKVKLDAGFLVKVLHGKMHISAKSIGAFIVLCKLSGREAEYFESLVNYGRAKKHADIKQSFEKILGLRTQANVLSVHQYSFYEKWYHTAVWSLIGLDPFAGDFEALGARITPPISASVAKESVELLINLKMLTRHPDGTLRATDHFVTTGEKWKSAAVVGFQKETMRLAAESIDRHASELRDISTLTVGVSVKDLPEIKDRLRELRQSILNMKTENEKVDCIYQINMQVFPLALPQEEPL